MFAKVSMPALILALIPPASLLAADVKVKTIVHKTTSTFEETVYVHDRVQRIEYLGLSGYGEGPAPHIAIVIHCDTDAVYELDLNSRKYRKYRRDRFPREDQVARKIARDWKEFQTLEQPKTVDTGETKDFFGHTAKHLVITLRASGEQVVDGWYLDIPEPGCAPEYMRQHHVHLQTTGVTDHGGGSLPIISSGDAGLPAVSFDAGNHFVSWGGTPQGVHIRFWYNLYLPSGLAAQATSPWYQRKVVEFSEDPIDPSLFEVPPEFKKVGVRELYHHGKH
ncbi:MAG TPA: hypothetical protein VN176_12170 [Verrucomicrobiae bacterium]|jgi:hypothetical protein|nr:hypothetical protein [Verrucomicrobiae bacterium]